MTVSAVAECGAAQPRPVDRVRQLLVVHAVDQQIADPADASVGEQQVAGALLAQRLGQREPGALGQAGLLRLAPDHGRFHYSQRLRRL